MNLTSTRRIPTLAAAVALGLPAGGAAALAGGTGHGWENGTYGGNPVKLPYVPNAKKITGAEGVKSHEGSVAWYRTTFKVPDDGKYVLRFESVNHKASVWIDGRPMGEHVGTYLPFEIDTELSADEEHTLVVRADWRGPDEMKA